MITDADCADFAERWAHEVIGTSYLPMPYVEIESFLASCLDQLVVVLSVINPHRRPPRSAPGWSGAFDQPPRA